LILNGAARAAGVAVGNAVSVGTRVAAGVGVGVARKLRRPLAPQPVVSAMPSTSMISIIGMDVLFNIAAVLLLCGYQVSASSMDDD
jgi:hypothetical protein